MGLINFADLKEKKRLSELVEMSTGKARCLSCRYEWTASIQYPEGGVDYIECPSCSLMKGKFIHVFEMDDPHWVCNCGNDLYRINAEGVYCPNCGAWQDGFYDTIVRI